MHRILKLRPSPACAIAFVALFVAASGIAYAAADLSYDRAATPPRVAMEV